MKRTLLCFLLAIVGLGTAVGFGHIGIIAHASGEEEFPQTETHEIVRERWEFHYTCEKVSSPDECYPVPIPYYGDEHDVDRPTRPDRPHPPITRPQPHR